VADVEYNVGLIIDNVKKCIKKGVHIAVFPELCVSGYSCGDLFLQSALLDACVAGVDKIAKATKKKNILAFVGLPFRAKGKLYNVAAALYDGQVVALIPKKHLPNYGEFYEQRHFSVLDGHDGDDYVLGDSLARFGNDIVFYVGKEGGEHFSVGCEICEDLWSVNPPSSDFAWRGGVSLILNLSASNEVVGKSEYRRMLVRSQSGRCVAGYVFASCGIGESTTDTVFSGHNLIAENGALLAESKLFEEENITLADIDMEKLSYERRKMTTFPASTETFEEFLIPLDLGIKGNLTRKFSPTPFVPSDKSELKERSELILSMQAHGLAKRLRHTGAKKAVSGISGGLDSTLALLVAAKAFDILKKDRKDIIAITMPGFGTTKKTKNNATELVETIGATLREVNISESVLQHFKDIGHDKEVLDVTYENAQARTRTLILMDVANKEGGLVIGPGDLSELALGWCTYNGDHMSMYAVNAGVPKRLVKYLVAAVGKQEGGKLEQVLNAVLNTEISPELLPPDKAGEITQKTEDLIGPYELHDFYLYYAVRWGFAPKKVFFLAKQTFEGKYEEVTLVKWLKNFYRRFFSQQFKRSCMPDGVKIGSVTLSPRADWRMPSDALATLWLKEVEEIEAEIK
ncbi:MAG: NAD(+) synthase, partial [Clostridia bacterium]|nr:NAD(+) synthase [Clostridia bacterium]